MGQASRPKRTYEETHKTKEERSAEIKNLLKKLSDLEITAKTFENRNVKKTLLFAKSS